MKKLQIVPAILETSKREIENKLQRLAGLVDTVQIDICDGRFVPAKTFASRGRVADMQTLATMTKGFDLELDMMVDMRRPGWPEAIRAAQPVRVILHWGSTDDWGDLFKQLLRSPTSKLVKYGLAVHLDSDLDEVQRLLENYPFSFVQVMGIQKVGYSGQGFSCKAYHVIAKLRQLYPRMPIAVDGGVKLAKAATLKKYGATRLGVNSGLFGFEDIAEGLEKFRSV